jgi:hypothetical protein
LIIKYEFYFLNLSIQMATNNYLYDILYNEVIKYVPYEFLCVCRSLHLRAIEVVDRAPLESFDKPFWRNIRVLWANNKGPTRMIAINDYVIRNVNRLKANGSYEQMLQRSLGYYDPRAKYIIDTLLITGECLARATPLAFNFVNRQLTDRSSALNEINTVDPEFKRKIVKVLCKCYSSVVSVFITDRRSFISMRVVYMIKGEVESLPELYSGEVVAEIDRLIFEDHQFGMEDVLFDIVQVQ